MTIRPDAQAQGFGAHRGGSRPRCRSRPLESCPASARAQDASRPVSPANTKAVCGQRVSRAGRRRLLCVSTRRNGSAEERARARSFCSVQSARESAPDGSKRSTSCSRLQWEPRDEYSGWSSCARRASGCRRAACATQIVNFDGLWTVDPRGARPRRALFFSLKKLFGADASGSL